MNLSPPIDMKTERPVPRGALIAAHLVPLVVLPAGLWRLALASGLSLGMLDDGVPVHVHGAEAVYVIGLTVVSEAAALLTFALVRPWGERVPAWVPSLGGRRIPPFAVIAPAAIGAVMLQITWTFAFRDFPTMGDIEFSHGGWHVLLVAAYLPLLLWAPLLAALTLAYQRRRATRTPVAS